MLKVYQPCLGDNVVLTEILTFEFPRDFEKATVKSMCFSEDNQFYAVNNYGKVSLVSEISCRNFLVFPGYTMEESDSVGYLWNYDMYIVMWKTKWSTSSREWLHLSVEERDREKERLSLELLSTIINTCQQHSALVSGNTTKHHLR